MKRMLILFPLMGFGCGFFYLFLALCNLRAEMENNVLREKRMLLERDRKLIILETSQISSFKNLTEAYFALSNSPKEFIASSSEEKGGSILITKAGRLASVDTEEEQKTPRGSDTLLFSIRTLPTASLTPSSR